jgi:hypothetical protein
MQKVRNSYAEFWFRFWNAQLLKHRCLELLRQAPLRCEEGKGHSEQCGRKKAARPLLLKQVPILYFWRGMARRYANRSCRAIATGDSASKQTCMTEMALGMFTCLSKQMQLSIGWKIELMMIHIISKRLGLKRLLTTRHAEACTDVFVHSTPRDSSPEYFTC